jgi:hypothetical protein
MTVKSTKTRKSSRSSGATRSAKAAKPARSKRPAAPARAAARPARASARGFADELAAACASTGALLTRYLAGFDDGNATRQAPNLPNHATWVLGHLALTMHRAAERISGRELPPPWDPAPFAFGSTPVTDRAEYPPFAEMRRRFDDSLSRLAEAIRAAGDEGLGEPVHWGQSTTTTKRDLAARMVFHNGTHTGQIVDLRRALGMPRLVG